MDSQIAKHNMLDQQIRNGGVVDNDILGLLESTPRENFMPESLKSLAYADASLPIGHGQKLWTPLEEAKILRALEISPDDTILEIGTLNGYMTALLAQLGEHVYSVDFYSDFTKFAAKNLADMNIKNVTIETGNPAVGWGKYAPYDVIVINGSFDDVPEGYHEDLNQFGRMFVTLGEPPVMDGMFIYRWGIDQWRFYKQFDTCRPRVAGFEDEKKFRF